MNSQGLTPFFDGHNDVLLRLFKREGRDAPRAFLDGEGKGQLPPTVKALDHHATSRNA